MRVAIGCDHGGIDLKEQLEVKLSENNIEFIDVGTDTIDSVDYPDYAYLVGKKIQQKEVDYGILICRTGIGMCISANKMKDIRCAIVTTIEEAKLCREHNNCNCIAFPGSKNVEEAYLLLDVFLNTKFSDSERHHRRVDKISKLEDINEL